MKCEKNQGEASNREYIRNVAAVQLLFANSKLCLNENSTDYERYIGPWHLKLQMDLTSPCFLQRARRRLCPAEMSQASMEGNTIIEPNSSRHELFVRIVDIRKSPDTAAMIHK